MSGYYCIYFTFCLLPLYKNLKRKYLVKILFHVYLVLKFMFFFFFFALVKNNVKLFKFLG